MSTILLPIKPQYVKEILEGRKRYEFRKNKPKRPVTRIVIYASCPQQLVVGEAIIDEILEGSPDEIWNITKEFAESLNNSSLHITPVEAKLLHTDSLKSSYTIPLSIFLISVSPKHHNRLHT